MNLVRQRSESFRASICDNVSVASSSFASSDGHVRGVKSGAKMALLAGFGGVLCLMLLTGLDSIRALHRIEARNAQITQAYIQRHQLLEQVRSSLYLSGSLVRDYLLETNTEAAQASLASLRDLRDQMNVALARYAASVRPDERNLYTQLKTEADAYWVALGPAFHWSSEERRNEANGFLLTRVFPRRSLLLGIADKIDQVNEHALADGSRDSAELFSSFRLRIVMVMSLTLLLGAFLATGSIVHSLRLERETRLRYEELQRAQNELKRLSAHLVQAQEEERRTISRELHDEVGQSLNALRVELANLAAVTPADSQEAQRLLGTARTLADESIKKLRNMALLLRPSMLDDFGLVPALHWQAREVSRRTGMRVAVVADDVPEDLPDGHRTCIYRVVQEALHNVSQHAEARNVRVAVHQGPGHLVLTVEDDGKGFDAARIRGLGLLGMAERAKHLGGTLQIQSGPNRGTALKVYLPLAAPEARASEVTA